MTTFREFPTTVTATGYWAGIALIAGGFDGMTHRAGFYADGELVIVQDYPNKQIADKAVKEWRQ